VDLDRFGSRVGGGTPANEAPRERQDSHVRATLIAIKKS
jgi:hypothetical protein